jgi:hypothetical protein
MLDPRYAQDPAASEQRVAEILHPGRRHHRSTRPALRTAAWHRRSAPSPAAPPTPIPAEKPDPSSPSPARSRSPFPSSCV